MICAAYDICHAPALTSR